MANLSSRELDALARAISERLRDAVPEGTSAGCSVADVWWRLDALVNQAGDVRDNLLTASYSILSHAQDEVIRDLAEGWPRVARAVGNVSREGDPGTALPQPGAEVVHETLRLWYGDPQRPALELPPISLAGVLGTTAQ